MSNHNPLSGDQWRARLRYTLRALLRDAERFERLTLTAAPADLNTAHVDYMIRPSYVAQMTEVVTALATGLYQVEVQARFHHHRPDDQADLHVARQHLTKAAQALYKISERSRGQQ